MKSVLSLVLLLLQPLLLNLHLLLHLLLHCDFGQSAAVLMVVLDYKIGKHLYTVLQH